MIAAVVFDLDGTLHDHDTSVRRGFASWHAAHVAAGAGRDIAVDFAEWMRLMDLHFDRYLAGELTYQEQRRERIAGMFFHLGLDPVDDAGCDASFGHYRRSYEAAWTAYDDVMPTLETLSASGVGLAVLTNGDQTNQQQKSERIGVAAFAPRLLAASSLPAPKPAGAAFLTACESWELDPSETCYVGDNLAVDAVGATDAGLIGVWLDRAGVGPGDVAWAGPTITTLTELPALISAFAPGE